MMVTLIAIMDAQSVSTSNEHVSFGGAAALHNGSKLLQAIKMRVGKGR